MKTTISKYLEDVRETKGAVYAVLIDPDHGRNKSLEKLVKHINNSNVDVIFVGGSLMMDGKSQDRTAQIKSLSDIPLIFFPGGVSQLNSHYDAMLFMSVLSGRNPHYLIGEQVIAAPLVKDLKIETIPTGYLLLDGGANSTVEFMSNTKPIPMNRPDITVAHALAAQYLGMKYVYLEAGSGAINPVPLQIVKSVSQNVDIPIIVGGGLRTPTDAKDRVEAGAHMIVTGTIIEESGDAEMLSAFADAIHVKE